LWENTYGQQIVHLRRFGHDLSCEIDNADPVNGLPGAAVLQFSIDVIDAVRLSQFSANRAELVGEDGVVFFKGVTDDDPVKDSEAA
jgi:hypothetical protein